MSKAVASLVSNAPAYASATATYLKPRLATFVKYAKVELTPPTPGDIPKAFSQFRGIMQSWRTGRYKQLTVKEAWLNTLVAAEVGFWFFIGECIGKRHLRGYDV